LYSQTAAGMVRVRDRGHLVQSRSMQSPLFTFTDTYNTRRTFEERWYSHKIRHFHSLDRWTHFQFQIKSKSNSTSTRHLILYEWMSKHSEQQNKNKKHRHSTLTLHNMSGSNWSSLTIWSGNHFIVKFYFSPFFFISEFNCLYNLGDGWTDTKRTLGDSK